MFDLEFILCSFVVFISGMIIDFLWVFYDKNLIIKRYNIAAIYSSLIGFCTWFYTVSIINNKYSALFWILGLYIGTILAGKFIKKD